MIKAIIYCRFSPRPNANDCQSNDRQEERCRAYCKVREYDVVAAFSDRNISGAVRDRPALNKAIAALTPESILVVDSADRLARDMLVALGIRQEVREAGALIEYADGTPPSTTAEGELVENVLSALSHYQRQVIGRRTKAGLARKKTEGHIGGRCPYGYRRYGGVLYEEPVEQLNIKDMRLWYSTKCFTITELSDRFGLTRKQVSRIVHKKDQQ